MCQPHQLWRFPDFSKIRDEAEPRAKEIANLGSQILRLLNEEEYGRLHDAVGRCHSHAVSANQCCSMVIQRIRAPVAEVWSVVRRFDKPQAYKHFIRSCSMRGDGSVGSTRDVRVVSGLPAASSTEKLEILDEERHVLSFKVVGGNHRLKNYRSITSLHDCRVDGRWGTLVIESYVVDVPEGNSREDTCLFADTIVKCNLQSLAQTSEHLAWRHRESRASPGRNRS